jgi:Icc-related predicted phosphoesterase
LTRIFHAGDPHASELVWRKYLTIANHHKADVLLLTGDLTGKAIVPMVRQGDNKWFCNPFGKKEVFHSREDMLKRAQEFKNQGYYVVELEPGEVEELQEDPAKMDQLFIRLMSETLERWLEMVEREVPPDVKVIVSPGNDDPFEIDEVIKRSDRVIYPEEQVIYLDDEHPMISSAWVTTTPWQTPRECSEEELMGRLEREFKRVDNYEKLVCNFHDPPYDTILDLAPKLDSNLRPQMDLGTPIMEHVGSKAVRELILKYQPLLALHGHIHESPGHCTLGRTLCINPGSEYRQGISRAYIIDLPKPGEELRVQRVEG